MAKRKLLKVHNRHKIFDIPADEDSLIRHYSLSPADRLEIELRRREHNRLGFAVQLCLMRYLGRALGEWSVFGGPVVATAILDRLLHHSTVITIRGDSYRIREKRRSGLLQKVGPTPETNETATQ